MATDPTAEAQGLLRGAIRDQHGLESEYVESVPLLETLEGTPREGTIHVFRVVGHPQAELAFRDGRAATAAGDARRNTQRRTPSRSPRFNRRGA